MHDRHRTDRERWSLRGPVRACTLRRTWSACGANGQCGTDTRSDTAHVEFDRAGALTLHRHENHDGSAWASIREYDASGRLLAERYGVADELANTSIYEYDTAGRVQRLIRRADGRDRVAETYEYTTDGLKQKTQYPEIPEQVGCGAIHWTVEGTDVSYSADGAAAIVLRYDHREQPVEATFMGRDGRMLTRVSLTYDERGLLVDETQTILEVVLPEDALAQIPAPELAKLQAVFGGGRVQAHRVHRYNADGRRIETTSKMFGGLGEDRQTRDYNERGDQVQEILESNHRSGSLAENGELVDDSGSPKTYRSEARFAYDYDSHGNWVKKMVEGRSDPNADFSVSTIETREIEYYSAS